MGELLGGGGGGAKGMLAPPSQIIGGGGGWPSLAPPLPTPMYASSKCTNVMIKNNMTHTIVKCKLII